MPKKWTVLAAVGFALFVVYIVYSSMQVAQVACEVCITFRGQTECRSAAGADAAEAQRTATDVACTLMTSGMTDSIACGNTPPSRLMCKER
jgi:hypothetical protein